MYRATKGGGLRQPSFISEIDVISSRESNCAIFGNAGETIVHEEEEEEEDDELEALAKRRCREEKENGGCAAASKRASASTAGSLGYVTCRSLLFAKRSSGEVSRSEGSAQERKRESAGATRLLAFRAA